MPIKILRKFIPLILITIILSSSQMVKAQPSASNLTYLPLVTLNRNRWLGPSGGYITMTAIDPSNPLILYAASWGSGVYKSLDGGQNWYPVNWGLGNLYLNSLAVDPVNPSTLYAGTYKNQIYKSQDGGKSWEWSGTGMQAEAVVYSIAIDPLAPSRVYAGTRGVSNNGNPPWSGILYRSIDAGQSWSPILEDVGGAEAQDWIYSIAIDPNEDNSIYIATHEHGPFRSNQFGDVDTWFTIHDGISDDSGRTINISPDNSEGTYLYYGVWHWDSVYKTVNGGNEWLPANRDIPFTKVYSMAIDPLQPENVFLATFNRGIMKTEDGATTWQQVGLFDDAIYHVAINPVSPGTIYAGTAGNGLFKSIDGGDSWYSASQGIQNSMVTKVILSPSDPNQLLTSVYGAGVYQSADHGSSWSEMNTGLGDKFVHSLVRNPAHPGLLYALTDTGGLFQYNLSNGTGWVSIGEGLPGSSSYQPAYPAGHPFATHESMDPVSKSELSVGGSPLESASLLVMTFAPSSAATAYLGTGGSGVYKSTDGGSTWQAAGLAGETVQSLAVDSTDAQRVYAATSTPGSLKISTDGGDSWTDAELPVTFYALLSSPTASNLIYAGTDDGLYLYQSGSWAKLGLAGVTVTSIAVDPIRPNLIIAGTNSGASISYDAGGIWKELDSNLNGLTVRSIDLDLAQSDWLYFSTATHGIFQALLQSGSTSSR